MGDITRDEGGVENAENSGRDGVEPRRCAASDCDADLSERPTVASAVYDLVCCSWDCLSTEIETRETDG